MRRLDARRDEKTRWSARWDEESGWSARQDDQARTSRLDDRLNGMTPSQKIKMAFFIYLFFLLLQMTWIVRFKGLVKGKTKILNLQDKK